MMVINYTKTKDCQYWGEIRLSRNDKRKKNRLNFSRYTMCETAPVTVRPVL